VNGKRPGLSLASSNKKQVTGSGSSRGNCRAGVVATVGRFSRGCLLLASSVKKNMLGQVYGKLAIGA